MEVLSSAAASKSRLGRRGEGEQPARSPSWPTLSVVVPPSVRPSVRGCNYNLDGQKMAVSNAIFSERRKREGGKEEKAASSVRSAAAKATIFGQEQAQMRAAVELEGDRQADVRTFLHVQTHISAKNDGGRRNCK